MFVISNEDNVVAITMYLYFRLAANKNGLRLNIPLHKGVDSLNTGMAAAVIAFEVKKQFIQAWAKLKLNNKENVIS